MKNHRLPFMVVLFFTSTWLLTAQVQELPYVEVYGTAELEVQPNEIYYSVNINTEKFYEDYDYNYDYDSFDPVKDREIKEKVELRSQSARKKLTEIFALVGVDDQGVLSNKYDIVNYDMYAPSETYTVKLSEISKLDQLVQELRKADIFQGHVIRFAHSDEREMRDNLKLEALKNAQNKAMKMAQALGGKAGNVIQIRENFDNYDWENDYQNSYYDYSADYYAGRRPPVSSADQKIKLKAQVWVRFSLL